MPITNTRDLIPFVNELEEKLITINGSLADWEENKFKMLYATNKVEGLQTTATSALVRADEAMAEIGTATFDSSAKRGKRLEDTLQKLKKDVYEIAASVEGSGSGGGELTSGSLYKELNNAIASVDATVEEGLKLDYRLRELQERATVGFNLSSKIMHMPSKHHVPEPSTASFLVPLQQGSVFLEADVTVLDGAGSPFLDEDNTLITGKIKPSGEVLLTALPQEAFTLYFPVEMKMKDIPEDFLNLFMHQVMSKNSRVMEVVLAFENEIEDVISDIEQMKGVDWTPDFSIMRNHQEIVKEGITPKGMDVEVVDGLAHVTFSYNDHPDLSHFIMERWDEEQKRFIPYDGANGIVNK